MIFHVKSVFCIVSLYVVGLVACRTRALPTLKIYGVPLLNISLALRLYISVLLLYKMNCFVKAL